MEKTMLRSTSAKAALMALAACAPPNPDSPMEGLIMSRQAPPQPGSGMLIGQPMTVPERQGGESVCAGAGASASPDSACQ
jgi:hypothetical protein